MDEVPGDRGVLGAVGKVDAGAAGVGDLVAGEGDVRAAVDLDSGGGPENMQDLIKLQEQVA
ncbi:hypothetical protein ACIRVK_26175 [Streptomyces sp. NPDC101152]|uniref:hypothetical protein n=1 Tax=Streptomyces sp. NPDC101152 TaxID=3366116 RepID=UPI0037FD5B68